MTKAECLAMVGGVFCSVSQGRQLGSFALTSHVSIHRLSQDEFEAMIKNIQVND